MNIYLALALALTFFVTSVYIAQKLADKTSKPYTDIIKGIHEMDIPIGKKIDLVNKFHEKYLNRK